MSGPFPGCGVLSITTDFGHRGPFVGTMKGVILRRLRSAQLIDLTHEVHVHWPAEAGFWLERSYRYFPEGSVHLAVVDPGVGTGRHVLLAVGDTISRIVDPADRATALLFGDAGTVTALEASEDASACQFILGSDGQGVKNLIVPTGGFRDYMACGDSRLKGRVGDALANVLSCAAAGLMGECGDCRLVAAHAV